VSQTKFVQALGEAMGKPVQLVNVPRRVIEAAASNHEGQQLYFGQHLDLAPITMQVHRMRRILGVKPTPLAEGLKATYRWYSKQKPGPKDYSFEEKLQAEVG
jgi:nucleoside-diphosphate-sugar epimerase